ncbi:MAG TPA: M24 family metallopeptidase [Nitrososphaerales archaeon]|nr:M24 family metallopeptidase [Nitrososphaerales archaeon]
MAFIKPLGYDPARCKTLLKERELDGMILTSNDNVFYATGIPVTRGQQNPILFALSNRFPPYSVIDSEGTPIPIVWSGAIGNHELWAKEYLTSFLPNGTTEELVSLVSQRFSKGARIGIESSMPYPLAQVIKLKVDCVELIVSNEVLDDLRLVKSPEEISKLKASLAITEKVEERIFSEMRSDWSVFKLVSRSKQLLFEEGATGVDHATIAIGNSNPEILEDLKGASGDIVVMDVGAILDGYVSDTRRLGCLGGVSPDLEELNKTMTDIVVETGRKSIQPGRTFSDVCADVEARYMERGKDPMFLNAGHSIGIQTEEEWIVRESTRTIQENMVINIELYSALKPGVHVGIEDTFLVKSSGGEQLSRQPHGIRTIR